MTNKPITQSQKRSQESVGALFSKDQVAATKKCLILTSSSDVGVMRNGGRNGARFAPQSFLASFKKFSQSEALKDYSIAVHEVGNQQAELVDFEKAQKVECEKIQDHLKSSHHALLHLGGGHDHVYPLLMAHAPAYKKIIVINIDAHADTRTDENAHSGTPFRQFARDFDGDFLLFQIGLHPYANSFSTLESLPKGKMEVLWSKDINQDSLNKLFVEIQSEITTETLVVFSIDADALAGHEVPGVSAVNPAGLTRETLLQTWQRYQALEKQHQSVMGIYELNPVYDTLASISMRTMASFFFESLILE